MQHQEQGSHLMHLFERLLSVSAEDLDLYFWDNPPLPWVDFLLNPRRLRGSDFLMRWSQGAWSEECVIQAVNETASYIALPYGPSGVAPKDDVREFELYFERLEKAGLGSVKRPDLLIFRKADQPLISKIVDLLGGARELPFTSEDDMRDLLSLAIVAIECENSLWKAAQMPDYGVEMTPQKRLGGRLGMKKSAVLPTVILKEEDRAPLRTWQGATGLPIHIWHVFYDRAFGIALDTIELLINSGLIEGTEQVFQAPGGATTKKIIYKVYYHYTYTLGSSVEEPTLVADHITDKNGHILPYVRFEGGKMNLSSQALQILDTMSSDGADNK